MEKVEKAKKGRILPYILFCLLPLAGGALSGLISRSGMDRYEQLAQPPLSPPRILFPIVWSILYILMGIGAARVYLAPERGWKPALTLFAAQLLVNLLWTPLFFALELRFAAFIWLLVLLVLARRVQTDRPLDRLYADPLPAVVVFCRLSELCHLAAQRIGKSCMRRPCAKG